MQLEPRTFPDGRGGSVSALIALPNGGGATTCVVLAHGAGNDMHSPLLVYVHEALAGAGYMTVRFNFPYKERRGRAPDPAPILERCYRSVLAAVRAELNPRRLIIGGKSLGGRMASHLAAAGEPVDGLIFLGYPLHPAKQPEKLRTAHLPNIRAPMLFFAGTRDPLCSLDLLRATLAQLRAQTTLHVIEDGDHSFAVRRSTDRSQDDVWNEIVRASVDWLHARDQEIERSRDRDRN